MESIEILDSETMEWFHEKQMWRINNMAEDLMTMDEAIEKGFTLSREKALDATGWSNATLGRKMKTNAVEFVRVKGKTAPTPMFSIKILGDAGITVAEPENVEEMQPVEPEKTALVKSEKRTISRQSQNNLKRISQDNFSKEFTNALLIPHKIYLTLKEASQLTNFPQSELFKLSELKFGRRVIKKTKLEKI